MSLSAAAGNGSYRHYHVHVPHSQDTRLSRWNLQLPQLVSSFLVFGFCFRCSSVSEWTLTLLIYLQTKIFYSCRIRMTHPNPMHTPVTLTNFSRSVCTIRRALFMRKLEKLYSWFGNKLVERRQQTHGMGPEQRIWSIFVNWVQSEPMCIAPDETKL